MDSFEFAYSRQDRERFRSGELARGWAARFPQLFSAADLQIALNQPRYHFYEWLAAVRLFSDHGYLSIAESYHFKRHTAAYATFVALTSPEIVELLSWGGDASRTQGPDLLTFRPDDTEWFFVEVKGPRDSLRPKQIELFARLENLSGRPVVLAHCFPANRPGAA
jgi:hypothetical protein